MSTEEGIKLGLSLMKEFLKDEFNFERLEVVYVDKRMKYTRLSADEMKKYVK